MNQTIHDLHLEEQREAHHVAFTRWWRTNILPLIPVGDTETEQLSYQLNWREWCHKNNIETKEIA